MIFSECLLAVCRDAISREAVLDLMHQAKGKTVKLSSHTYRITGTRMDEQTGKIYATLAIIKEAP